MLFCPLHICITLRPREHPSQKSHNLGVRVLLGEQRTITLLPRAENEAGGRNHAGPPKTPSPMLSFHSTAQYAIAIAAQTPLQPIVERTSMSNTPRRAGRHFLQIPGPTPVPDRILRAMDMPVIDHRGPEFKKLGLQRARRHQDHLQDRRARCSSIPPPAPAPGRRRCVNTLSPGDKVLMYETGHFATLWKNMAVEARAAAGVHRLRLAQRRRRRAPSRRG